MGSSFKTPIQAKEVKLRREREAKMAAKLRHAGIVAGSRHRAHGNEHARHHGVRPRQDAQGLRRQRRLLEQTIEIVAQTADALGHAHAQGVVHGDIKPANLMITDDGSVKIAEFGIAKSQSGSEMTSNITTTGSVLGTPRACAVHRRGRPRRCSQHGSRCEPYDKDCSLELAAIYEEDGLAPRARQMYEQVAFLDPDHEIALKRAPFRG